ncbi:TolC family protein [Myroides sp. WP-1]|uniref:TolC family protein n=1 Tax=Myroides sp. WP-1 TaxID=2759944 RepID=UPI0015FB7979|nr:TolC family protein [Myroides sp. WP-1]MBB1138342.1 TolC family protein [Myroides sp. WP-1]
MNSTKNYFSTLFLLLMVSAFAQDKQWTLDECISHAIVHNISVKQIEINEQNKSVNLELAKYDFLPVVSANANHSWTLVDQPDPQTGVIGQRTLQESTVGLSVGIDIIDGLQKQKKLAKARLEHIASVYQIQKIKEDIALSVINSYLQIIFNKELVHTNQVQLAYDQAEEERVQALVDAGVVPAGDLLDVKATVASSNQRLISSQNELVIAKLNLAQLLQIRDYESFDVIDTDYQVEESELMIYSPQDIAIRAFESLTNIKTAELNVQLAEKNVQISKGAYYPKLTGFYNFGSNISYQDRIVGSRPSGQMDQVGVVEGSGQRVMRQGQMNVYGGPESFFRQFDNNKNSVFGLSLSIPIFNGMKARKTVQLNQLALEQMQYEKEAEELKLEQLVFKAYTDTKSSYQSYEASVVTLESREKSLEYARARYAVGLINIFELNQNQNLYVTAQSNVLKAKYDYIFKNRILEYYFGVPLFKRN